MPDGTLLRVSKRMAWEGVTVHGFRSSFADWASERGGMPREIAELSLAHEVGNAVERAYRRSDLLEKRRGLMEAWARFCLSDSVPGKVVKAKYGAGRDFAREMRRKHAPEAWRAHGRRKTGGN